MCGIAGIISLEGKALNTQNRIDKMVMSQIHRGPDDNGIAAINISGKKYQERSINVKKDDESDVQCLLGFCRLSIQDLSALGHQPMYYEEKQTVIVYNGEIYNGKYLKEDLVKKGWCFSGKSDTEIILKYYLEYGFQTMIGKLNGMFALCIVDVSNNKMFLARDRFGIKPLYYSSRNKECIFASELKAIMAVNDNWQLDTVAAQELLIYGYNSGGVTLVKDINEMLPGEYIEYTFFQSLEKKKYFDINDKENKNKVSYRKSKKMAHDLLKKAVDSQMISDVAMGCQLSGGIDSSIISIMASDTGNSKLQDSVSVIFDNDFESYNEKLYMDEVNEKLSLNPHQIKLNSQYFIGNLKKAIWHLDTIPAFCNEIGILCLAENIKKYSTVLLSGEGADELLGGYIKFGIGKVISMYCKSPIKPFKNKIKSRYFNNGDITFENFVIQSYGNTVKRELAERVIHEVCWDKLDRKHKMYYKALKGNDFDKQRKYEITMRLPGLLNRQDKMTMAASVENRVPFLDNEFAQFALSLPPRHLIKIRRSRGNKKRLALETKYILKDLCREHFSDSFIFRKKMGFDIPLREYLKDESFRNIFYGEILTGIRKRNMFEVRQVEKWYEELDNISLSELILFWRTISLELWNQIFMDSMKKSG